MHIYALTRNPINTKIQTQILNEVSESITLCSEEISGLSDYIVVGNTLDTICLGHQAPPLLSVFSLQIRERYICIKKPAAPPQPPTSSHGLLHHIIFMALAFFIINISYDGGFT
uniref:Uncharacterized protein n=1 Tax=Glossina brevipalpis TaxID=37001 RepID=A0A1A9W2L5_9MUSC